MIIARLLPLLLLVVASGVVIVYVRTVLRKYEKKMRPDIAFWLYVGIVICVVVYGLTRSTS